jgi:hypothetical protein
VMVVVSLPQTAPLGALASSKLLLQCLVVHSLISLWCRSPLASST